MKRRTNLFYTDGPDSKFLTFSNYTEALTGNIISTDTKLFPSKFLCLKINGLNSTTKPMFIDFLMRYYENKLSTIKDYLINSNMSVENFYPLSYLLESICYVCNIENDNLTLKDLSFLQSNFELESIDVSNEFINNENIINNSKIISYIGEISEEDYNGTYTDIICYIDMNAYKYGSINVKPNNNITNIAHIEDDKISDNKYALHGWKNFNQEFNNNNVSNITPIFDYTESGAYEISNKIESIQTNIDLTNNTLEFNVIIPLFDVVDINYKTNNTSVYEMYEINMTNFSKFNIPLGIWMYADKEEDTFITLEKDLETGVFPAWSLLISTQFKPFPYSNKIVNNANSSMLGNSFSTFSEILTRMNTLLNKFNEMNNRINKLNTDILTLNSKLNNIDTEENVKNLKLQVDQYKTSTSEEIKDLENKILSYISNIKWSSVG